MLYAVQVMNGQEEKTIQLCRALLRQGLLEDIFCPRKEGMKRYQGEWHKTEERMFPGYIFVETGDVGELCLQISQVPKLARVLGTGNVPVALTKAEADWLKAVTNPGHVAEMSVGFMEGDRLSVQAGALFGKEALVKKINRHKRTAVVQVEMFSRTVEMTLGLEVLGMPPGCGG